MSGASSDKERSLRLIPVSRETDARLIRFVDLLTDLAEDHQSHRAVDAARIWTRHIADSLQLLPLAPDARLWIDLGSGGGFPGIPIACLLADVRARTCIWSRAIGKKAAFLREAARITGAAGHVHPDRIENFAQGFEGKADVVTAARSRPS